MAKKLKSEEEEYQSLVKVFGDGYDSFERRQKYTINELVELFKKKYSIDYISNEMFKKKKFFSYLTKYLDSLFKYLNYNEKQTLASTMIEEIQSFYCPSENGKINRWFLSAVLDYCFDKLRDHPEFFRDLFCKFSLENGNNEAFCRLFVISKIEMCSRFLFHDTRDWHKLVIKCDGEIIKNNPYFNEDKGYIESLWNNEWYEKMAKPLKSRSIDALHIFFSDGFCYRHNFLSVYWETRLTM